jgi:hypothetical protein
LPDRHNGRRSDADLEIDEYYADLNGGWRHEEDKNERNDRQPDMVTKRPSNTISAHNSKSSTADATIIAFWMIGGYEN